MMELAMLKKKKKSVRKRKPEPREYKLDITVRINRRNSPAGRPSSSLSSPARKFFNLNDEEEIVASSAVSVGKRRIDIQWWLHFKDK